MNRFENRLNTNLKSGILKPVYDNEKEDALNIFKMIDLLNEFDNENKKLEKENLDLSEELDYYKPKCASLETGYIKAQDESWRLEKSQMEFANELGRVIDENEQLKKQKARYKRLSEIRNEEINNRILTIKEFIDNCSNEEVKKELEDLFYSEVNEYDLSKKYRKLYEENEDLKKDNAILKQALTRLVETFDDKISNKSSVRDLIK